MRWSCHLQEELLYLAWPHALLGMAECLPQLDDEGGLLWRGLRVRIGMAHGLVSNKKPLNSGRADYFGVLPNAAARVSALAVPGQVRRRRRRQAAAAMHACWRAAGKHVVTEG